MEWRGEGPECVLHEQKVEEKGCRGEFHGEQIGDDHGGDGRCSRRSGLGARLWGKERIGGGRPVEVAGESRTEVAA